jgi:hypothetical protein
MDKPTLDRLSQINDDLVLHLQWLMEKKALDSLAKRIPIVDRLTHGVAQLSGIVAADDSRPGGSIFRKLSALSSEPWRPFISHNRVDTLT